RRPRAIARVSFPDVAQKTLKVNRVSFFYQLLITAPGTLLSAGGDVDLDHRVREHNRAHIATVGNQPGGLAKSSLPDKEGRPDSRQGGNAGGGGAYRLAPARDADVRSVEHGA